MKGKILKIITAPSMPLFYRIVLVVTLLDLIYLIFLGASFSIFAPYKPKRLLMVEASISSGQGIVAHANNEFAFDLYAVLAKREKGNILYSPFCIFSSLALAYEGANGETADEIKSVFHFPKVDKLRKNFAIIYNDLKKTYGAYELRMGNALWVQRDYPLLKDYKNIVKRYYSGKAENLDFAKKTEKSRQTINKFIEKQTGGRIKGLIPAGCVNQLTMFVLTNTIHFTGTWKQQFDPEDTEEMDFKITPDSVVKVPMMRTTTYRKGFNYADLGNLQILELPYLGGISMLILLPTESLDSIEPLSARKLAEYKSQMQITKLDAIFLPKFEIEAEYILNDHLKTLGMPTAFNAKRADFSGMTNNEGLFISSVIHHTCVKVNEKGTKAYTATATIIACTPEMVKRKRKIFLADHPFIFIIQQKHNGNILFFGRLIDPTQ